MRERSKRRSAHSPTDCGKSPGNGRRNRWAFPIAIAHEEGRRDPPDQLGRMKRDKKSGTLTWFASCRAPLSPQVRRPGKTPHGRASHRENPGPLRGPRPRVSLLGFPILRTTQPIRTISPARRFRQCSLWVTRIQKTDDPVGGGTRVPRKPGPPAGGGGTRTARRPAISAGGFSAGCGRRKSPGP